MRNTNPNLNTEGCVPCQLVVGKSRNNHLVPLSLSAVRLGEKPNMGGLRRHLQLGEAEAEAEQ